MEGEVIPFHHTKVRVNYDVGDENILFLWPIVIMHEINEDSPFYNMSAEDLLHERFELIVVLEGIVESTSSNTQARASYLPNEILWGHRFEQMVSFKKDTGEYKINFGLFNSTYEVDTPLCSAAELDEYVKSGGRFPSVSLPPSRGPCLVPLRESSVTESGDIRSPRTNNSDITEATHVYCCYTIVIMLLAFGIEITDTVTTRRVRKGNMNEIQYPF
ncbi:G protein-activated inward rectifier potassium channel 4 [Nymphon striatum]|nr:G protein-activated inward rectifier potassium channel 4 [Nymphon striatum]